MQLPFLKGLAATVKISPAPRTLAHSVAVLQKLSSYGQVNTFRISKPTAGVDAKVLESLPNQTYRVLYSSSSDLSKAVAASPISIDVNHDIPDPRSYDAYDILGLHSRQRPEPASFVCELSVDDNPSSHIELAKQIPFRGAFDNEREGTLYKALLETKAPSGIVRGISALSSNMRSDPENNKTHAPTTAEAKQVAVKQEDTFASKEGDALQNHESNLKTVSSACTSSFPSLMNMYRDGVNCNGLQNHDVPKRLIPTASHEKQDPVH